MKEFTITPATFAKYAAALELYDALLEAETLYSHNALIAREIVCGGWINRVREALAKAEGK